MTDRRLNGIVLAGGSARRLSGVDKPMLEVGGVTLLGTALLALRDAYDIVVVGPAREGIDGVRWATERPPGSGPVAALAAGFEALGDDRQGAAEVAVLAGDLPGVTQETVARLRAARGCADGAVLVDATGRRQWLIGVWDGPALRAALPARPAGASLHSMLSRLAIVDVPARTGEGADVDTAADLSRARADRGVR